MLKGDRGANSKINCGMDTRGEREKGTCKETGMEGVQAATTSGNLEKINGETERNGVSIPEDSGSC
jgi:hypothetical protein